jgi:undecaprenyl-diphosphatase
MAGKDSPYLSVLVAMHVATAIALVVFFWSDWVRLIGALFVSIRRRQVHTPDQRLAWLLVIGTIPVGLIGLALESLVRDVLGKPIPSAIFLMLNGLVLYAAERMRSKPSVASTSDRDVSSQETVVMPAVGAERRVSAEERVAGEETVVMDAIGEIASDRRLARLSIKEALLIGGVQSLALLPGISRSGITIVGGLFRGLRHDDAARFAFLLSTPVILAAGVLKIPSLFTQRHLGTLGPALAGSVVAGVCAYFSVRFLTSYFETRTLTPFAIYCAVAGLGSLAYLSAMT